MKTNLEFHEAADEFPLLRGERLKELVDDIREHGLREPIMLCEGKILDGRNRYIACKKAGVEPRFTDGFDGNPFDYAWSLNGERRDLTADQRYLIWKSVAEKSGEWEQRQAELQAEANRKRSEATSRRPRKKDGTLATAATGCGSSGRIGKPPADSLAKALNGKYDVADNGCWIWNAYKNENGYGQVKVNGVTLAAHRAAYMLEYGEIEAGLMVLHSCHHRACINPGHLRLGTAQDNANDAIAADRTKKGEASANAKLGNKDVEAIRKKWSDGETQKKLSNEYGVHINTIGGICRGIYRRTSTAKAKASKTNRGTVERMDRLEREAPNLAKKVKVGEIAGAAAVREMKESKRELRRTQNKKKVAQIDKPDSLLGNVKFATIVIDPPWDWGDEGDVNQLGRAKPDYHTLSLKEIHELPVSRLSDTDCHLYMWITNRSLPKGFALLEAWGFRYVTCITWVKPSIGMGNYFRGQTEHVLFGVKGSQQLKRKDQGTVFMAPRGKGGHSSKPREFYDIVESCSPGPYLDMFSRAELEGWSHWGESSNE